MGQTLHQQDADGHQQREGQPAQNARPQVVAQRPGYRARHGGARRAAQIARQRHQREQRRAAPAQGSRRFWIRKEKSSLPKRNKGIKEENTAQAGANADGCGIF